MRDLHEVVDLHVAPNPGFAQRGAVHGGVGAQLHVVVDLNDADLGDFFVLRPRRGKPEAVAADDHPGMQDDPPADDRAGVNGDVGVQDGIFSNRSVAADKYAGIKNRAFIHAGAAADERPGHDGRLRGD